VVNGEPVARMERSAIRDLRPYPAFRFRSMRATTHHSLFTTHYFVYQRAELYLGDAGK